MSDRRLCGTVFPEARTAGGLTIPQSAVRGDISGAALDVFAEEPLPEGSPLRTLDNAIISRHPADNLPDLMERKLVELFRANLRRCLGGEPLADALGKKLPCQKLVKDEDCQSGFYGISCNC